MFLTYFVYSSLCLLIPYSCNLSLLSPLSPGNHKFVFCVCVSVSALYIDSFVLFKIPHIKDTKYNILQVHSCCCKWHYCILFHGWVTVCCTYVPCLYPSVKGHLGCFHVLAIVNCAAINTVVHVSFQTMFLSGYMPSSGTVGSNVSSIFSSLRNPYCSPTYIPTNTVGQASFLHTFSRIYCL